MWPNRKQLNVRALTVIDFLAQAAERHEGLRERILQCLCSWVSSKGISPEALLETKMFGFPFEALHTEDLFDAAVDCVEALVEKSKYAPRYPEIAGEIVRRLYPLHGRLLESLRDQDEAALLGYARIFLQAGEYYSPLIVAAPENFGFVVEMVTLLSGAGNPPEVNRLAFSFWSLVAETLGDVKFQEMRSAFTVPYQNLMVSLISRAGYAPSTASFPASYLDELASTRQEITEVLRDCCQVIGGNECLAVAFTSLDTLLASPASLSWTSVEAVLFAIDAIATAVDFNTSPTITSLIQGLLTLPSAAPQMQHPAIRVGVVRIFYSYSQWTRRNNGFLDAQVAFILAVLGGDNGQFQTEAVTASVAALNALSKSCGRKLSAHLDTLFPLLSALPLAPIDLRVQADETLGLLVSALPAEKLTVSISTLLQQVVADLHKASAAAAQEQPSAEISPQVVASLLARLGTVLGSIKPHLYTSPFDKSPTKSSTHPCIPVMSEVWPIMDRLFQQFSASPTILEALCTCMSKFVSNCKIHTEPFLLPFLAHVHTLFAASLNPCLLEASETWIKVFCEREVSQRRVDVFLALLNSCTGPLHSRAQQGGPAVTALLESPDMLVAYFDLLATSMSYCSDAVLCPYSPESGSLAGSLAIAKVALETHHQEVIDRTVAYLTNALQVSLYGPSLRTKSSRNELSIPTTINRGIEKVWRQQATELMTELSRGVCSSFPITVSWGAVGELYDVLAKYFGGDVLALATESGIEASTQGLLQQEIDDFLQNLKLNKRETNTERVTVIFETFAQLCRRRSGKQEVTSEVAK